MALSGVSAEELAVGANTPKRHMNCSPDDTARKPMKVMRKENLNFYDALDEDLGIGQLWKEDTTEGVEARGSKDGGDSTNHPVLPPKKNVKKRTNWVKAQVDGLVAKYQLGKV